jgi:hypothetical protein
MAKTSGRRMALQAMAAGLVLSALALVGTPGDAQETSPEVVVGRAARSIQVAPTKKKAKKAPAKKSQPAAKPAEAHFMNKNADGSPVRYNPCAPIHYVVNVDSAPAGALGDIQSAFERLGSATGLTFSFDGTTDEVAEADRGTHATARYPGQFEPVIVGFHRPGETSLLNGSQLASGGSIWYSNEANKNVYVTGVVAVDTDQAAKSPTGFGSARSLGVVLLHEVGHVLGLDHAPATNEVMYPSREANGATSFGPSDKAGLTAVGSRDGCVAQPAYPY